MCLPRPSLDRASEDGSFLGGGQKSHLCKVYSAPEICLLCGRYPRKVLSSLSPPSPNLWLWEAAKKQRPAVSTTRPGTALAPSCLGSSCSWSAHSSCGEKYIPRLAQGRWSPALRFSPFSVPCSRSPKVNRMHTLSPGSLQPGTSDTEGPRDRKAGPVEETFKRFCRAN